MNISKKAKDLLLFSVFVLLTASIFWVTHFLNNSLPENLQANASAEVQKISQSPSLVAQNNNNDDENINAKGAISVNFGKDTPEKVLFDKNADKKLPIASLVKLMTSLITLKNYNLDQKIVISKRAMAEVGEQGDLKEGQVLSVKNLLYITLIESSNRAASALSEVIGKDKFIALMNSEAEALGLSNTRFKDTTGLGDNSYSSAEDLSKLSEYLFLNYPLFREIVGKKEFDLYLPDGSFHHKLKSTNKFLGQVPRVVGGKTGWTDVAKGCFMIIQIKSPGEYLVHIILGADDRFLEMQKLIKKTVDTRYQVSRK